RHARGRCFQMHQTLDPYPAGWYALCFAAELPAGGVRMCSFMGREVLLFRTHKGQVCATDPYCPHLGAHMGRGGTVQGELLRCPFHGFCYDSRGACVKTGYETKPPPNARLRMSPVREINSMLLMYHDPNGDEPNWEVPALEWHGWSAPVYR